MNNGPGPRRPHLQGVWADVALSQVLYEYFERSGLMKQYRTYRVKPETVFDIGQLYDLYHDMKRNGQLVTVQEIKAVLDRYGVAYDDAAAR